MGPPLEIRFVMEGPQAVRTRQKKRARLVTACDACRIKKIKCHQPNPKARCEACKASQVSCQFGDRDKYHAERGMSVVNKSSSSSHAVAPPPAPPVMSRSSSTTSDTDDERSPFYQWSISDEVEVTPSSVASYSACACTSPMSPLSRVHAPRSRCDSFSTTSTTSTPSEPPSPAYSPAPLLPEQLHPPSPFMTHNTFDPTADFSSLFEASRPNLPRLDIMEHLLDIFFDHLACQLPFLDKDSTLGRLRNGTISEVVANGIAALSSRFSDRPEIHRNGPRHDSGEPFLQKAKMLVVAMMSWPTVDVLHGLVLIAWADYGSARDSGLFMYARMASAMLLTLGLGNEQAIQLAETESEREMLRLTWGSVARIDMTSSWVTGRPSSLKDTHVAMVAPQQLTMTCASEKTLLYGHLTELFKIRDEVTTMMNSDSSRPLEQPIDTAVRAIQEKLVHYFASLPSTLLFNRENFLRLTQQKQGSVLLLLHMMFHGANTLVNWPSLFKEFDTAVPHNIEVSCSSAKSLVDSINIAISIDPTSVLANPFFDVPLSVAARAFLAQRYHSHPSIPTLTPYDEQLLQLNLTACMDLLGNMSNFWSGAGIVRSLLEQRGAQTFDFPETGGDWTVQVLSATSASGHCSHSFDTNPASPGSSRSSASISTPSFEHPILPTFSMSESIHPDDVFASFFQNSAPFGEDASMSTLGLNGLSIKFDNGVNPCTDFGPHLATGFTTVSTAGLEQALFSAPSWS